MHGISDLIFKNDKKIKPGKNCIKIIIDVPKKEKEKK